MQSMINMKIVSYNILAQRFVKSEDIESFDVRVIKIIDNIASVDPSVICLQEVELSSFQVDFYELLKKYDFHGHVVSKKRSSPIGNVILWKKEHDKISTLNTSASVLVSLMINGLQILIANVHLKAQLINGEKQRLQQLVSVLKHNPDIICGDFNDTLAEERAAYRMLNENYKILTPGLTCYAKDSCNYFINKPYWPFDHFAYKAALLTSAYVLPSNLDCIIPNDIYPSDHLMIVFIFE